MTAATMTMIDHLDVNRPRGFPETSSLGNGGVMSSGTSKRYPPELGERAVRMVAEIRHERSSDRAVIESVAAKFGVGAAQRRCTTDLQGAGRSGAACRRANRRRRRATQAQGRELRT